MNGAGPARSVKDRRFPSGESGGMAGAASMTGDQAPALAGRAGDRGPTGAGAPWGSGSVAVWITGQVRVTTMLLPDAPWKNGPLAGCRGSGAREEEGF